MRELRDLVGPVLAPPRRHALAPRVAHEHALPQLRQQLPLERRRHHPPPLVERLAQVRLASPGGTGSPAR
jgi:hypothetical protein